MKKWEYKTLRVPISMWSGKLDIEKVDEILNKMGRAGWELVTNQTRSSSGSDFSFYYTFKREI